MKFNATQCIAMRLLQTNFKSDLIKMKRELREFLWIDRATRIVVVSTHYSMYNIILQMFPKVEELPSVYLNLFILIKWKTK